MSNDANKYVSNYRTAENSNLIDINSKSSKDKLHKLAYNAGYGIPTKMAKAKNVKTYQAVKPIPSYQPAVPTFTNVQNNKLVEQYKPIAYPEIKSIKSTLESVQLEKSVPSILSTQQEMRTEPVFQSSKKVNNFKWN